MHKNYLSLLNGKANLWKRIMLEYPVKLEKELSPEDKELHIFLFYGVLALDTCFDPSGEEKVFDLDIYQINPFDLIYAYNDIVEALLCFYFFDYGYHPHLIKKYCEIRNKVYQEVGAESYIKSIFKNASSVGTITRECFQNISEYFNIPQEQKRINDLYAILQFMYSQIESNLKNIGKSKTPNLSLIKQGVELDNGASC